MTEPRPGAPRVDELELRLLADQLDRMRAMLFGYSERFFERIRTWTLVTLTLLVVGASGFAPAAFVPVPFLVPFAFLETGYLFSYTVFARRHAERLERAINERFGREVLAAALLWGAGMLGLGGWVEAQGQTMFPVPWLVGYLVPLALAWTAIVAAYLVWAFLTRRDEDRLVRELDSAYRDPAA